MKYISYLWFLLSALCLGGCADDEIVKQNREDGALLNMYASVSSVNTRLAELPLDQINTETDGKQHVGLYIYYEDDYAKDDLSKPYIRNLQCKVDDNGKLTPTTDEPIYIYDRMTIVAFYPYNASMSKPENYFTNTGDEKAYPITESDYEKQTYIPYRVETNVNPTNAYMVELQFKPQQTFKVEVVLTAKEKASFPQATSLTNGEIKLLPTIDAHTESYTNGTDRRENWVDAIENFPKENGTTTGGNYVRRYTAYIWKSNEGDEGKGDKHHDDYKHHDNTLEKGEILFESNELTLVVPTKVSFTEGAVYRYGYNMDNGEIFIPTSDKLVYDATSLKNVKPDEDAYQVCDIDLKSIANWTDLTDYSGTYDGGGHAIRNLKIDAKPTSNIADTKYAKQMYGLFAKVTGTATLMNINLVSPSIKIDYSAVALTDTCYVGTICGLLNPDLSEESKLEMIMKTLPKELSETVKKALAQERLKDFAGTTCTLRGCKVTDPSITVTGNNVHVGAMVGGAGNQSQKGAIIDSYVSAGSGATVGTGIAVNATADETKKKYETARVSGFCGILSNGSITHCYSSLTNVSGFIKNPDTATGEGTPAPPASIDIATGFCNLPEKDDSQPATDAPVKVTGCYTVKTDENATKFADGNWPGDWPLFKNDETATNRSLSTEYGGNPWPCYKWTDSWKDTGTAPSTYPTLIWETPFTVENKNPTL